MAGQRTRSEVSHLLCHEEVGRGRISTTASAHFARRQNGFARRQNGFARRQNGFARRQNGSARRQNGFARRQNGFARRQNGSARRQNGSAVAQKAAPGRLGGLNRAPKAPPAVSWRPGGSSWVVGTRCAGSVFWGGRRWRVVRSGVVFLECAEGLRTHRQMGRGAARPYRIVVNAPRRAGRDPLRRVRVVWGGRRWRVVRSGFVFRTRLEAPHRLRPQTNGTRRSASLPFRCEREPKGW